MGTAVQAPADQTQAALRKMVESAEMLRLTLAELAAFGPLLETYKTALTRQDSQDAERRLHHFFDGVQRRANGPYVKGRPVQFGVLTLTFPTEYRIGYETASWHKTVTVQPGDYPVHGTLRHRFNEPAPTIDDNSVSIPLPGKVTASRFSSEFCGNVISSKVDEYVGEELVYNSATYAHALAWSLLNGNSVGLTLCKGYLALRKPYTYTNEHGVVIVSETAGIYFDSSAE